MNKKELLEELEEKFKIIKEELGFKSGLEEINSIFFIKDAILNAGFVSESFSRQLCSRIVETYVSWNNYLHSLIVPNPGYLLNMNESKMFDEEERRKIMKLVGESMALISMNQTIGLTKDKKEEGEFIDNAVRFWKKTFKPELIKITKKINSGWKEK